MPRGRGRPTAKTKQIFAQCIFVLSGDFGGKERSHTNVTRWITTHGGVVEPNVSQGTTHVICSLENYEKKVPEVREAMALTAKKCKIVTWDWLEDCLINTGKRGPRLLNGSGKVHSCRAALADLRRQKKEMVRRKEKFEENGRVGRELVDPELYHIYRDAESGFEFKIILTRVTLMPKMLVEKYTLFLFESHALPHLYMSGAKYNRGTRPTAFFRENMVAKEFDQAFKDFRRFFEKKTGVPWEERFETDKYEREKDVKGELGVKDGGEGSKNKGGRRGRKGEEVKDVDVAMDANAEVGGDIAGAGGEVGGFRWIPPGQAIPTATKQSSEKNTSDKNDRSKSLSFSGSRIQTQNQKNDDHPSSDVEMRDQPMPKQQAKRGNKKKDFTPGQQPHDRLDARGDYGTTAGHGVGTGGGERYDNNDTENEAEDNENEEDESGSGSESGGSTEFYSAASRSAVSSASASASESASGQNSDAASTSDSGSDSEEGDEESDASTITPTRTGGNHMNINTDTYNTYTNTTYTNTNNTNTNDPSSTYPPPQIPIPVPGRGHNHPYLRTTVAPCTFAEFQERFLAQYSRGNLGMDGVRLNAGERERVASYAASAGGSAVGLRGGREGERERREFGGYGQQLYQQQYQQQYGLGHSQRQDHHQQQQRFTAETQMQPQTQTTYRNQHQYHNHNQNQNQHQYQIQNQNQPSSRPVVEVEVQIPISTSISTSTDGPEEAAETETETEEENPYKSYAGFAMKREGKYRWVW